MASDGHRQGYVSFAHFLLYFKFVSYIFTVFSSHQTQNRTRYLQERSKGRSKSSGRKSKSAEREIKSENDSKNDSHSDKKTDNQSDGKDHDDDDSVIAADPTC